MKQLIPWERCEFCDEYICNIHGYHTFECPCPGMEWWDERGVSPYSHVPTAILSEIEGYPTHDSAQN